MNKVVKVLTKVPWRKVAKVVGVAALGTASVMGAMETDEKTQDFIKKGVSKLTKKDEGSN